MGQQPRSAAAYPAHINGALSAPCLRVKRAAYLPNRYVPPACLTATRSLSALPVMCRLPPRQTYFVK